MKQETKMQIGTVIIWKECEYKIVKKFGDMIHVRPVNSNGRVRMFSNTISLMYKDGELIEYNFYQH